MIFILSITQRLRHQEMQRMIRLAALDGHGQPYTSNRGFTSILMDN